MLKGYSYIRTIKGDDAKKIFLVMNDYTKQICVEKVLKNGDIELYNRLKHIHDGIPEVYQVIEDEEDIIVVEEYIQSPTLEEYRLQHHLEEDEIVAIMNQLLKILMVLHASNPPIIHRDIKPENIFYNGYRVVLADFDIARSYKATQSKDTEVLGTVGYAAPEQFGFDETGVTADIYACGVLLNVLLTEELPYKKQADGTYRKIVAKATSSSPEDRYQSAQEMMKALNRLSVPTHLNFPNLSHPLRKIVFIVYSLLMLAATSTLKTKEVTSAFGLLLYRFWVFFTLIYIPLCFFDPLHLYRFCLFKKNTYLVVRIFGRIVSLSLYWFVVSVVLIAFF